MALSPLAGALTLLALCGRCQGSLGTSGSRRIFPESNPTTGACAFDETSLLHVGSAVSGGRHRSGHPGEPESKTQAAATADAPAQPTVPKVRKPATLSLLMSQRNSSIGIMSLMFILGCCSGICCTCGWILFGDSRPPNSEPLPTPKGAMMRSAFGASEGISRSSSNISLDMPPPPPSSLPSPPAHTIAEKKRSFSNEREGNEQN
mmetsp:Transcript_13761/g.34919  ORF Transcript_13761/g.34919 Transcript_13761/m.34919 type:complete len:205 (+) Transcript_13761:72-686(+)